eukprot:11158005-Lingulodinium_polyedra.AAC.1
MLLTEKLRPSYRTRSRTRPSVVFLCHLYSRALYTVGLWSTGRLSVTHPSASAKGLQALSHNIADAAGARAVNCTSRRQCWHPRRHHRCNTSRGPCYPCRCSQECERRFGGSSKGRAKAAVGRRGQRAKKATDKADPGACAGADGGAGASHGG